MDRIIESARAESSEDERRVVADEVSALVASPGISRKEFTERIGTSTSRLSTYESGKVIPSDAPRGRAVDAALAGGPVGLAGDKVHLSAHRTGRCANRIVD